MALQLAVAADLLSALAMLVVAGAFFLIWRSSRAPLHLLFAVAFGTLAGGISTVGTSEFDLSGNHVAVDAVRVVAHTAAPLMLVIGYWASRRGASVAVAPVVGFAYLVAALLAGILYLAPPGGTISVGSVRTAFVTAHALQFVLYLGLVVLSARSFSRGPSPRRALVPLAFLAYSFSKYSWILIDLGGEQGLVPFVYVWRFTMLALMLAALLGPFVRGVPDGAA